MSSVRRKVKHCQCKGRQSVASVEKGEASPEGGEASPIQRRAKHRWRFGDLYRCEGEWVSV